VKIAPSNKVFADVNSEADRSDNNLFQVSLRHRPDGACDNRLHAIPAGSSERRSENLHRPGLTAVPVLTVPRLQWSNVLHMPPSALLHCVGGCSKSSNSSA